MNILLVRLLAPGDFGLMAMILVGSRFLNVFVEAGLGTAIVQRQNLEPRHLSTAFWMNVALGSVLTVLFAGAAPGLSAFFHEPRLGLLAVVLSVDFLLGAFGIVELAWMQRTMQFRRLAVIQSAAVAVGGLTAVVAAVCGAGVWSLVLQILVTSTVRSVLATLLAGRTMVGRPDMKSARDLWKFGSNLTAFLAVNYWARNADNFVIGRWLGESPLGLYDRAYQLMLLPLSQVSMVVSQVLLSALSRMQNDLTRLKNAYLRSLAVTALVTFPTSAGLFVVAPQLVDALFGPRWQGAGMLVRIFCLAAIPDSIGYSVGVIYQSQGRTDIQFRWGLARSAVLVGGFIAGVHWGLAGVAWAYTALSFALTYPGFVIPGQLIGLRFVEILSAVAPTLLLSVVMAATVWTVGWVLTATTMGPSMTLAVQIITGVVVYGALVRILRLPSYLELRALIARRFA